PSSHQRARDFARQEGWTSPWRSAALTMCAVTEACLSLGPLADSWLASMRNRCSAACVARKPRHRRLRVTSGNNTRARRKSFCAGRSSALNRLSRSHISWKNLEQPAIHEPTQKFHQVGAKQFRFDIEFHHKLLVSRVNAGRTRQQLPHARASLVQSEVLLGLEVQQDGFSIENTDKNVGRCGGSVRK